MVGKVSIWEDPRRFKYNRYFSEDMLKGNCAGCDMARKCRGGCTVTAFSATGERFDNPYCVHGQKLRARQRRGPERPGKGRGRLGRRAGG